MLLDVLNQGYNGLNLVTRLFDYDCLQSKSTFAINVLTEY